MKSQSIDDGLDDDNSKNQSKKNTQWQSLINLELLHITNHHQYITSLAWSLFGNQIDVWCVWVVRCLGVMILLLPQSKYILVFSISHSLSLNIMLLILALWCWWTFFIVSFFFYSHSWWIRNFLLSKFFVDILFFISVLFVFWTLFSDSVCLCILLKHFYRFCLTILLPKH